MITPFIRVDNKITTQDIDNFLWEFADGTGLQHLPLCELAFEWLNFVNNNNNRNIQARLPNGHGIYAIFARRRYVKVPVCFYVGISGSNIRDRIRTHLNKDIKKSYRNEFNWLSKCTHIYVCSATITTIENRKEAKRQLKAKLELLEACFTVLLRPKFLTLTAGLS